MSTADADPRGPAAPAPRASNDPEIDRLRAWSADLRARSVAMTQDFNELSLRVEDLQRRSRSLLLACLRREHG